MGITAPPAETAWLLHHVLGFEAVAEADTRAILEEATKLAEGVLAPLDRVGDRVGARFSGGVVTMPDGFAEAYRAYAEGGWVGIAADPDHGGQGLPRVLALAAFEPVSSANMAFGLCPMLSQDAIALLETHGTAEQRSRLLGPLIAGRWSGTMCLTEPQAGSDLSTVRTRATPNGDGTHAITGEKIYITYGEHGLTENIVHMVLARLPDAPAGSAGISLFAVPKTLPDGTRNGVVCAGIEHKLGIHASPTCTMRFEAATGELVGPVNRGLPCMFAMMNAARLGVAMQGVAIAERAFRRAAEFSTQRAQGGTAIVAYPDVRRMLLTMRALALGGRLLALYAALRAEPGGDAERAALLIPVAKAWCGDAGVTAASLGVQVHGGMGFIEETGAAQHLRDARITPIYEGTNGIQALTLLRRGLLRDQGASLASMLGQIDVAGLPALRAATAAVRDAAAWLRGAEAREAEAGAGGFLQALGTLVAGWLCATLAARDDAPTGARQAAEFFVRRILPGVAADTAALAAPTAGLLGTEPVL
jgi:alkylation response protein AidB-like acyl-CoA dehydrogenase